MSEADPVQSKLLVLIVTCRKSPPARIASARAALEALNLPLDIEVIDGLVSEDAQVDQLYNARRNWLAMKRPLSRTEIAVYGSHRAAWQHLVASERPAALVLEDDFAIKDQATVVTAIQNWSEVLGEKRDIVKLFDFAKKRKKRPYFTTQVGKLELAKWAAPTAGMVAYFISQEGAKKYLSRKRIFRQVDEDAKYYWELGLNIWSIPGNPIIEISPDLGGSLVEKSRLKIRRKSRFLGIWGTLLTVKRKLHTHLHLLFERATNRHKR